MSELPVLIIGKNVIDAKDALFEVLIQRNDGIEINHELFLKAFNVAYWPAFGAKKESDTNYMYAATMRQYEKLIAVDSILSTPVSVETRSGVLGVLDQEPGE